MLMLDPSCTCHHLLWWALGRGNAPSRLERQPLHYAVQRHVITARFRIDLVEIREASRALARPHTTRQSTSHGTGATLLLPWRRATGEEQMMFIL
jgi:hypothetical protein